MTKRRTVMVERIARYMVAADERNGGRSWEQIEASGDMHAIETIYDRARAALAALHKPTEAMVKAGTGDAARFDQTLADAIWSAMVEEAGR